MYIKEISASLYPWDLADEGIASIADELEKRCQANCLYLVGLMHFEKRPMTSLFYTHNPNRKYYVPENSRAYFHLDESSFRHTALKPMFTERDFLKGRDWLEELTTEARKRGMKAGVELSHTLVDTDIVRQEHPEMLQRDVNGRIIESIFGQTLLCPNNPEVIEYQKALFSDCVRNHDIDFIQTCIVAFSAGTPVKAPWFFDKWMNADQPALGDLLGLARGGCFCEHCRERALAWGYDWNGIVRDMKHLHDVASASHGKFQNQLMENHLTLGSNITESLLLVEFPGLMEFIRFRIQSMTELFRQTYEAVHAIKPDIDVRYNNFVRKPEYMGLSFSHIAPWIDSVRDSDYSEQRGAPDKFVYKRSTLMKVRRGIGFDKDLIAALAVRPNATPELIRQSLMVLSEMGVDGLALGHYDGAHLEMLDAFGQGLKEANIVLK